MGGKVKYGDELQKTKYNCRSPATKLTGILEGKRKPGRISSKKRR